MKINIKRIYEKYSANDGFRILVDRLWPRGIKKEKAKIDLWLREIASSDKLRKWFSHYSSKWQEFKKRYKKEIKENKKIFKKLKEIIKNKKKANLLYSAKDKKYNNAVVLKEILQKGLKFK